MTATGWSGTINYRLSADGLSTRLSFTGITPGVSGAGTDGTVIAGPLPVAYRPLTARTFPMATSIMAASSGARMQVLTGGNIAIAGVATSALLSAEASFPLDL